MRNVRLSVVDCRIARPIAMGMAVWLLGAVGAGAAPESGHVDFARDVRPILSDKCFHCHGPDETSREADLRLDLWEGNDDSIGAMDVIVQGEPDESMLIERIAAEDPEMRMPPVHSGKTLEPEQIEIFRRWIKQGAEYKPHWAFVAPQRPELPKTGESDWVRNPIDAFVLARLEDSGLTPSPPAPPAALLRRLSLDLIGLPPTLEEVTAFEATVNTLGRDKAYEQEVERLLASPHYGERWGRVWLDSARYADSDGFEKDKPRDVWMYRDWVIKSLNDDMPYDRFLVEQIAGDLLPSPTQDDLVATGFLRNSMTNAEGGIDPEQFRMEAMYDRMDAIGKSVLGLTVQCAQCHTHKYDPITHTDYYRLFAFLNNCHEKQVAVYTDEDEARREQLLAQIAAVEDELQHSIPDWRARMAAWEAAVRDDQPEWRVVTPKLDTSGGQKHYALEDGSILAAGYAPSQFTSEFPIDVREPRISAIRLELLNDPSLPMGGPGRSLFGLCALSEFRATVAPLAHLEETTEVTFETATADVNPAECEVDPRYFDDRSGKRRITGPCVLAIDGSDETAWGIDVGSGRSNVPRKAVFVLKQPIDASDGIRLTIKLAQMHGEHYEIGTYDQNLGRFRFSVTSDTEAKADPLPAAVRAALAVPANNRTPEQERQVFSYWRTTVPEWKDANALIESLWRAHPRGTSQLVVAERETPRETHRLERGNFLTPAEKVEPGVPGFLHPLAEGEPANRLGLAHWLADRRSPTTARTFVNRVWQSYFGTGLVSTAEDFGLQGDPPSHPELLDWLAVEFMDHGWSQKHLHRLIVNSATYQQASNVSPEQHARDPDNRLLDRGPRFRVDAEVVRDIALAASGLLNLQIGGPSVFPPAPEFLFKPPASYALKRWNYDTDADKYRRAMYTFRFRSVPYPALQTFDAPNGDVSCPRRVRSNTPLQALTTLNEDLFLECARALAVTTVAEGGDTDEDRITYAVRRCLSRDPKAAEMTVLQDFLDEQRERFDGGQGDPVALVASYEQLPPEARNFSPAELAAWTAVARVVLNLDETITKE